MISILSALLFTVCAWPMSFTIILNCKRKSITENLRVFFSFFSFSFFFNEVWLCPSSLTLTMRVADVKNKNSRARFWSSDLWVMGPARFHCATLLRTSLRSFFAAPISKSSQIPVRTKRESWNDRNAGYVWGEVMLTYCCLEIALVFERFKTVPYPLTITFMRSHWETFL